MVPADGGTPRNSTATLTDWAIQEVRTRIVVGAFAPGERLPIEQLAEELGISRVPLREAIRSLEAEGLISTPPHRGATATALTVQDAEDAYSLLEQAEMRVVERAAKASDPNSIALMKASLEVMREHVNDKRPGREALESHRAFHFAFFDRAGDGLLLRHLRMLWYTCERYVMSSIPEDSRAEQSLQEHEELLRLVEAGDVEQAREHLRQHLRNGLSAAITRISIADATPPE